MACSEIRYSEMETNQAPSMKHLLEANRAQLLDFIEKSLIGNCHLVEAPYGDVPLIYMDYIASGKSLNFIENYIQKIILPNIGKSETNSTWTSQQTAVLCEQAKKIIRRSVNADDEDGVFLTGSGSTGAFHLLISALSASNWGQQKSFIRKTQWGTYECKQSGQKFQSEKQYRQSIEDEQVYDQQPPIVILSVYEHHANILMWREWGATTVFVQQLPDGSLNYEQLEQLCQQYQEHPKLIASFSSGSNVTGVLTDVKRIARIVKSYGGLVFFDYAASSPYTKIDMSNDIDGIFISIHKFVGGPESPGLLICKKTIFGSKTPVFLTKSSLLYQTDETQDFKSEPEKNDVDKDSIGIIRAGLIFQLKDAVSPEFIEERELQISLKVSARLTQHPNIFVLGPTTIPKFPVFSLMIRFGAKYIHHHFAALLLNDLFGIQVRSGCSCARPYSFELLGISQELLEEYDDLRMQGYDLYTPGYFRINFNYFISDQVQEYCLQALEFIADNAIYLLPLYQSDMKTAEFVHRQYKSKGNRHTLRKWLSEISYATGEMTYPDYNENILNNFTICLERANRIIHKIKQDLYRNEHVAENQFELEEQWEKYRWFIHHFEAVDYVKGKEVPFIFEEPIFKPLQFDKIMLPPQVIKQQPLKQEIISKRRQKKIVPKLLSRKIMNCVTDMTLLEGGDRVLVAVSGGADSIGCIAALYDILKRSPIKFQLGAVTVDPMVPEYNPEPLKGYFTSMKIPYYIVKKPIADYASRIKDREEQRKFCYKARRKLLIKTALRYGFNVVAVCHTLDDLAENFILSLFCNGKVHTTNARYYHKGIRMIKPLAYSRSRQLKEFCQQQNLPTLVFHKPDCFRHTFEREKIRLFLASQEQTVPDTFSSICRAISPLLTYDFSDLFQDYQQVSESDNSDEEIEDQLKQQLEVSTQASEQPTLSESQIYMQRLPNQLEEYDDQDETDITWWCNSF